MNNYRRVFTSSAKFRHVYGDFYLPFWVDTRKTGILAITAVSDLLLIVVFKLYTMTTISFSLVLLVVSLVGVYKLDDWLKFDALPFEQTVKYYFKYIWNFRFKRKQIYQGERLESNNKRFQIL
ncbi:major facilitator superfamily transporter [Weissella oryzae SG25]|uniref:Major facilitator superfamily transporter n=1 Tax=Weissella oryzae (strain DSM 25784 / JCM 18191 / LMG 30913 / SG25) TaxID=1329250 RepID=A0A069CX25_WEIOS|nr:MFS transporter permease [Weissella oryzae]GAK31927.1 major facilitator superfamily transporter [Weissella oryzae SG25]